MAHMSHSQHYGKYDHIKGGHKILYGDYIMGPASVPI